VIQLSGMHNEISPTHALQYLFV